MHPGERLEIQAIRNELDSLRTELEAVRSGSPSPWLRRPVGPRLARRLTRVSLVALMLAMPVLVSAGHQFTDVPTSHTFHTAISRIYGAGLTSGCSLTKFCPSATVTRGQMAAFLARGLGRGAGNYGVSEDDWAIFEGGAGLSTIDLAHGGTSGGTGHVLVTASVSAYTDQDGVCPCELAVQVTNVVSEESSPPMFSIIGGLEKAPVDGTNARYYETSINISHLFSVESGVTNRYVLAAFLNPTASPSAANHSAVEWSTSAVYIPFGATGGNPSLSTAQGSKSPRAN